jgi:hypothetical protein
MAKSTRKKKLFNYEFADGEQQIPSTYKVKCNVTGELIPIYHRFLNTLIKKKYKNNFSYFTKTFAKKGAVSKQREEAGYTNDLYSLNAYSDYLVICYKSCLETLVDNFNEKAVTRTKNEMVFYADCFMKHFNRDITKFVLEK